MNKFWYRYRYRTGNKAARFVIWSEMKQNLCFWLVPLWYRYFKVVFHSVSDPLTLNADPYPDLGL